MGGAPGHRQVRQMFYNNIHGMAVTLETDEELMSIYKTLELFETKY